MNGKVKNLINNFKWVSETKNEKESCDIENRSKMLVTLPHLNNLF